MSFVSPWVTETLRVQFVCSAWSLRNEKWSFGEKDALVVTHMFVHWQPHLWVSWLVLWNCCRLRHYFWKVVVPYVLGCFGFIDRLTWHTVDCYTCVGIVCHFLFLLDGINAHLPVISSYVCFRLMNESSHAGEIYLLKLKQNVKLSRSWCAFRSAPGQPNPSPKMTDLLEWIRLAYLYIIYLYLVNYY